MTKIAGSASRVFSFLLGSPALGANNAVLADTALDDADPTVVTAGITQPAVARTLSAKGNDANVTGDVIFAGTNIGGEAISETVALAGATEVFTAKAFASVTSITLPPWDTADTERVRCGTGPKLALPVKLSRNSVIAAFLAGVRETTAPAVAFSAAALESNTIQLSSALAGTAVIVDLYETN